MALGGFFNKGQDADTAEGAQGAAEETSDTVEENQGETNDGTGSKKGMGFAQKINQAKASVGKVGDVAKGTVEALLANTLAELKGVQPILAECGFIIGDVVLTMSIPPGVKVVVEQTSDGESSLESFLNDENELSKIQLSIIKGIMDAYSLNRMVNPHGYTIGQVEMELTFPPKVHVHLNSKESRAFG